MVLFFKNPVYASPNASLKRFPFAFVCYRSQPLGVEPVRAVLIGEHVHVTDACSGLPHAVQKKKEVEESRCGDMFESRGLIKPERPGVLNETPGCHAVTRNTHGANGGRAREESVAKKC